MANQPISVARANAMIQENISYMTGLGVNMTQQTQSVAFDGKDLQQWLSTVMPFADELRICIGVYPAGTSDEGRITTILWPYKNGQPATMPSAGDGANIMIEPFNEGQQHP
ncbi:MAG: hypothetical protein ACRDEB_00485 [Chitinophagaceae bacterium]